MSTKDMQRAKVAQLQRKLVEQAAKTAELGELLTKVEDALLEPNLPDHARLRRIRSVFFPQTKG